jgi:hypothetical protein
MVKELKELDKDVEEVGEAEEMGAYMCRFIM